MPVPLVRLARPEIGVLVGLVWLPFLSSRVAMFGAAWAFNAAFGYGRSNDWFTYPAAWQAWLSWDAVHYLRLAGAGYPANPTDPQAGYFPLFPLLLHLAGSSAAAGLAVALVLGLAGLTVLTGLTQAVFGAAVARRTAWVAAWWPLGFIWTAVYTEGLFLALAAGALWAAWRGRPWLAALLAALAGSLRLTGAGLILPLLVLLRGRARLAALAPMLGILAFGAYLWEHTGRPSAFLDAQVSGRPHVHPFHPFDVLLNPQQGGQWELATGLFFVVLVAVLVWVLAHEPTWRTPSLATVAGLLGPAVFAGTLFSFGRYAMVCFPLYWALQKAPGRLLAGVGVPVALVLTAAAGNGRLTP